LAQGSRVSGVDPVVVLVVEGQHTGTDALARPHDQRFDVEHRTTSYVRLPTVRSRQSTMPSGIRGGQIQAIRKVDEWPPSP
jgi:hypothetical protein